jgi:hypothetical protein
MLGRRLTVLAAWPHTQPDKSANRMFMLVNGKNDVGKDCYEVILAQQ